MDLRISATYTLDGEEETRLKERIGSETVHVAASQEAPKDWPCKTYGGRIGAHFDDTGTWVHYDFRLSDYTPGGDRDDDRWNAVTAALSEALGEHEADVHLRARVPRDVVEFASQPVSLSSLPGFTHMKGIRLAMENPDRPGEDLYSILIDEVERLTVLDARSFSSARIADNLFERAWGHMMSVVSLVASFGGDRGHSISGDEE